VPACGWVNYSIRCNCVESRKTQPAPQVSWHECSTKLAGKPDQCGNTTVSGKASVLTGIRVQTP